MSLHEFRGKVVILAFNDSECTTVCPLTTTAMLDAKAMLGAAGSRVQLLGVDANPKSTAIEDMLSYSQLHGLLHQWHFLTGSLSQLKRVWRAYGIEAEIQAGLISHTPALYVIDPQGRERKLYMTQLNYATIGQLGQLLAHEASRLLPGHPPVRSNLSYAQIPGIGPSSGVSPPRAGGGTVHLGPGTPRLVLFFATWDRETTGLAGRLDALNGYQSSAVAAGLPRLTAVDQGSVEPSPAALESFLRQLPRPVTYPVAIDRSGRLADGYEVQGQPWFVLTSRSGRILWYWEPSTQGWLSRAALIRHVREALATAPKATTTAAIAQRELADSPRALAALHAQASQLLGTEGALEARIRSLRGYPIVLNAGPRGARRASPSSACSRPPPRTTDARSRSSAPTPTTRPGAPSRSSHTTPSAIPATRRPPRGSERSPPVAWPGSRRRSSSTGPARSSTSISASTTRRGRSMATSTATCWEADRP